MEQWKSDDFSAALAPSKAQLPSLPTPSRSHSSHSDSRQRPDVEIKDQIVARKVQKADREKLRRDRLNEQFLELGNTLDPDRPKNDKATILTDTIQMLKDLTSDVNRLKTEYTALSEESHELTQEKNELREEKASLKSDIENLNVQYQQRLRVMYPWAGIDPSSVVMCPRYSYPMPIHIPPGQVPMHPSLQPFPFFRGQHPGAIPAPCSTLVSYPTPANPPAEKLSAQHATTSHVSSDSRSKSSDHHRGRNGERCVDSTDVATDLELKMPGTSAQQDSSSAGRKGKHSQRRERSSSDGSSSCRYSSSQVLLDSSYSSVGMPKP